MIVVKKLALIRACKDHVVGKSDISVRSDFMNWSDQ